MINYLLNCFTSNKIITEQRLPVKVTENDDFIEIEYIYNVENNIDTKEVLNNISEIQIESVIDNTLAIQNEQIINNISTNEQETIINNDILNDIINDIPIINTRKIRYNKPKYYNSRCNKVYQYNKPKVYQIHQPRTVKGY